MVNLRKKYFNFKSTTLDAFRFDAYKNNIDYVVRLTGFLIFLVKNDFIFLKQERVGSGYLLLVKKCVNLLCVKLKNVG